MDVERAVIAKLFDGYFNSGITVSGAEYLITRGIHVKHFADPASDEARIWLATVDHIRQYNAPPTREAIQIQFPHYRFEIAQDDLAFIADEFIKHVKRRETQRALVDIAERIDNRDEQMDLDLLLFEAAEQVSQVVPSSRVARLSDAPSRMELLRKRMELGVIPGVQLGWPTIDNETLGIQPHELVVFAAYSNAGKSSYLQASALAGYLVEQTSNKRLFISLEMDGNTLLRKFDAMATQIQLRAIKAMDMGRQALSDDHMRTLDEWAIRAERASSDILVIDDIDNCSVERVLAETMRYKPVATYTDYLQYMDGPGDNSYSKVGAIAKGLKKVARTTGIPQITAAQTNRAGAKDGVGEDNIADSIEIYRSADWMFGIDRTDELDAERAVRMKIVKARDGRKGIECKVGMDFETMDFAERTGFGRREQIGRAGESPLGAIPDPITENPFMQKPTDEDAS